MAMLAYREFGKKVKGITKPNVVACNTAHAAFDKACFYFGIELRKTQLKNNKFDIEAVERLIDKNTICLIASAPEYPFGNMDPVSDIAKLAQYYGIGCHSDCCLGSYINPFAEEAGFKPASVFDFRNEGVTTISCDTHKYGYGPKGMSVLMFRTK
jgi:sphinganine-1-phosphate aldolase